MKPGLHNADRREAFPTHREPSFPAQSLHDVDGGDVNVTLRAAVMRFAGEDGWNVPIKRLVVEGFAAADLVAVAAEPCGEMMMHGRVSFPIDAEGMAFDMPSGGG